MKLQKNITADSIDENCSEDCPCSQCIPDELYISFSPTTVRPGGSTIIKLWVVLNEYPFIEQDLIAKTISVNPNVGNITPLGNGEYLYNAPDTLTVDSAYVNIFYEAYTQHCAIFQTKSNNEYANSISSCIDCPPPAWSVQINYYASELLTITHDSLYVEISPSEIFAGDTANIIIKRRLNDGTLVDFDSSQTFEIATLEGCILGNLLVSDSLANYFYSVHQPIKFVVSDSLVSDTGLVLIKVGLVDNNYDKAIKNKAEFVETSCFTGNFISNVYQNASVNIGPSLKIIYPTEQDTFWITEEPQMPNIQCLAIFYPLYSKDIMYEWKFIIRKVYQRRTSDGNFI
ncbi:hypothetical protein [Ignavibacterium sp.]|uniref:hypothetical protein n=1 Tax=Ignavibacterium sp. TaxID=2651167 RepID=UPI00307E11E0